jgi:CRP/FNR family cyclic AMP-dependent transcriptional regulator
MDSNPNKIRLFAASVNAIRERMQVAPRGGRNPPNTDHLEAGDSLAFEFVGPEIEETFIVALKQGHSLTTRPFAKLLGEGHTTDRYRKDQIIFSQDDPANAIFYIQEGRVKVTVVSERGKEAVIAILGTNDFFGEGCLAGQPRRTTTVTTMTEAVIVRLQKSAIARMAHMKVAFWEMLIAHLLNRNTRIEADLVDHLLNSSEKRLARLLVLLANLEREGAPGQMITQISQETLAEMIGTTRSRVSFFMNKFRKLGFIDYDRDIKVHRTLLASILHDQPQIRAD